MTSDAGTHPDTPTTGAGHRTEYDSMGEIQVPADAKWRAQTQRAVQNFPISGRPIERAHIEALARIKAAAATVNAQLGVLDPDIAEAVRARRPRSPMAAGTRTSRWTSSRPARAPRPT